jgi:membrane associated rhomboid family serine protease
MSIQEFKPRQFQQVPPVVKYILIINVALFVASRVLFTNFPIDNWLDLHYYKSSLFMPHQFITHLFMHANISHLFFNMLGVYMFGSILENIWGAKRFINFYILCGLGAALAQYAVYFYQDIEISAYLNTLDLNTMLEQKQHIYDSACLGASGALFGLLVAFAMMFPNTYLNLYFVIPVKAKYVVIGYGLLELFSGVSNNLGDNVAHFAHLGGLVVGVIIMLIWKRNKTFFY